MCTVACWNRTHEGEVAVVARVQRFEAGLAAGLEHRGAGLVRFDDCVGACHRSVMAVRNGPAIAAPSISTTGTPTSRPNTAERLARRESDATRGLAFLRVGQGRRDVEAGRQARLTLLRRRSSRAPTSTAVRRRTSGTPSSMRVRYDESDERTWYVGFDRSARLLEMLVLDADADQPLLIHADKARPQFVALL